LDLPFLEGLQPGGCDSFRLLLLSLIDDIDAIFSVLCKKDGESHLVVLI
jgi:hypothetical protein